MYAHLVQPLYRALPAVLQVVQPAAIAAAIVAREDEIQKQDNRQLVRIFPEAGVLNRNDLRTGRETLWTQERVTALRSPH